MLTEQEWNALDDEAPERQFNNYLDYVNSISKPSPDAISNQGKGANLTEEEQLAATRLGASSESNGITKLDADGKVTGAGGIRYDPYKEQIVVDPNTGAPIKMPIGAANPQTGLPYDSFEEIAVKANEGEKWAEANQEAFKDSGAFENVVNPKGESVPIAATETKEPTNTIVDWNKVNPESFNKKEIDPSARYKLKSIMDAYNDGEIDKASRDYLIVDAIAKGLGSLGRIVSNVGAQYTGGSTVDATPEQTLWNKRNEEMSKSAIESEKAGVSGSREQREYDTWAANQVAREYNNASLAQKQKMAAIVQKYAEKAPNDTIRIMYMDIASRMLSGGTINEKDLAVSGIGEIWNFLTGTVN